jgi:hypothetical protein
MRDRHFSCSKNIRSLHKSTQNAFMENFSRHKNKGRTEPLTQKVRHFSPILSNSGFTRHVITEPPKASFTQIRTAGAKLINWDGQTNVLKLRELFSIL